MNMNTDYAMTSAYTMMSAEDAARALKRGVVAEQMKETAAHAAHELGLTRLIKAL